MTETDKAQTVTKRQIQRQNRKVMDKKRQRQRQERKIQRKKKKRQKQKRQQQRQKRQTGKVCGAPPAYEADN